MARTKTASKSTPKRAKVPRSHRTFRLTKRRDYVRKVELTSYISAALQPLRFIKKNKKLMLLFIFSHAVITALLTSSVSQSAYQQLSVIADVESADIGALGQAVQLATTGLSGGLNSEVTASSGLLALFMLTIGWLIVIWLVRARGRGATPSVRDGWYNAGTPLVPMIMLGSVLLLQVLPAALAVVGYQAASAQGFLTSGVELMLVAIAGMLLIALSLYWITTTILSLVVVTLPGMFPFQAHRHAYTLVNGRRLTFMLRWLWLLLVIVVIWIVILTPVILLERVAVLSIPVIAYVPIVPLLVAGLGSASLTYAAIYSYNLYREVVDYDSK